MIEITDLDGDLGEFHLRDINLTVNEGEYLAILGPTGAGKTVLIEYIVGIYKPDRGSIRVDGEDITPLYTEERNIGYVPQDYALFPNLTVERNLSYGLEARRMPQDQITRLVSEMIARLKIDYIRHRMPLHLSGGEKQRVALGRALATEPRVLLLDEPLSALDENLRTEMARELKRIQRGVEGTFIHVCHNFEEASDVADRIAIMNEGTIIQIGTLKEIMEAPKNAFVARFVKSQNMFDGVSDGSTIRIGQTSLAKENPFKGDVIVAIRPENIAIVEKDDQGGNVFSGQVESTILKPSFTEISVNADIPLVVISQNEKHFMEGDDITVRIPQEKVLVIEKS
ncbi:MAG: ABC transporter ATP-binding protein [Deltaproteobacteria bacterium]|nr:ABC transporter ATP-binding protein [Deltaproteobacteria bacterium]